MKAIEDYYNTNISGEFKKYIALNQQNKQHYGETVNDSRLRFENFVTELCNEYDKPELSTAIILDFYDTSCSMFFLIALSNETLPEDALRICTNKIIYADIGKQYMDSLSTHENPREQLLQVEKHFNTLSAETNQLVQILEAYVKYWSNENDEV